MIEFLFLDLDDTILDFKKAEHIAIRKAIAEKFGEEAAAKIRIQYGGSMKGSNVKGLMAQPEIDGGLIGGASLKAADFAQVVNF